MTVAVAALAGTCVTGHGAQAETVVQAKLWDKGPGAMDMSEMHAAMGMAMQGAAMHMETMGITLEPDTIPAGEVTFRVLNDSGEFYHEMIISPIDSTTHALPYLETERRVDETALSIAAEQKELKSHASGTLKTTLKPGAYIVFCNIAGHYAAGMWSLLTVTE